MADNAPTRNNTIYLMQGEDVAFGLADFAETGLSRIVETKYTNHISIQKAGIYHCDCSAYIEHILQVVASPHLGLVHHFNNPDGDSKKRALVSDFYDFFTRLPFPYGRKTKDKTNDDNMNVNSVNDNTDDNTNDNHTTQDDNGNNNPKNDANDDTDDLRTTTANTDVVYPLQIQYFVTAPQWAPVSALAKTRRGDILCWNPPDSDQPGNTGHIALLAETPTLLSSSPSNTTATTFAVKVYDSSPTPHFDDSRIDGDGTFHDGVGTGTLHIQVDADTGAPVRVRSGETETGYRDVPILVGRILYGMRVKHWTRLGWFRKTGQETNDAIGRMRRKRERETLLPPAPEEEGERRNKRRIR